MGTPAADIHVDEPLVTALLAAQCPELAALPVRIVGNGWDNTIARVGDDWMVRVPRREAAAALLFNEQTWLPLLAPSLPLPVPVPWFCGVPDDAFPWAWSVCRWLPGRTAAEAPPADPAETARTLAGFIAALHQPAPPDAPLNPFRGVALAERAAAVEHASLRWATPWTRRVCCACGRNCRPRPHGAGRRCGCTATCTRRTCSPSTGGSAPLSTSATCVPATPPPTSRLHG
jgi:aminoglycoside phosphotransferase (APT) family kinase protein